MASSTSSVQGENDMPRNNTHDVDGNWEQAVGTATREPVLPDFPTLPEVTAPAHFQTPTQPVDDVMLVPFDFIRDTSVRWGERDYDDYLRKTYHCLAVFQPGVYVPLRKATQPEAE
jgi:hypothetical protein